MDGKLIIIMSSLLHFQEGVVRAKLQKLLEDYDDVRFERSFASEENIRLVCHFSNYTLIYGVQTNVR